MKKYLLTGHAGFLGRWVCKYLLEKGDSVVGVDTFEGGHENNVRELITQYPNTFVSLKVIATTREHKLQCYEKLFETDKYEEVIHLGAFASEGLSPFIRSFIYENNVIDSSIIINECIKHKCKLTYASSIATYGHGRSTPFKETDTPMPIDPYGIAKYVIELDIQAAHHTHGLQYKIFRPHNIIATYQNLNDPVRNVLGIFIKKALFEKKPFPIFGDGLQKRQFSYGNQVAKDIIDERLPWNEVYNVGGNISTTVLDLAKLVAKAAKVEFKIEQLPERIEAKIAEADHSKIEKYRGKVKEPKLESIVKEVVEYAEQTQDWTIRKLPKVEVWEGLPESWKKYLV